MPIPAAAAAGLPLLAANETVRIAQPGVPAGQLARLDGEDFAADAELDLHGLTLAQAAPVLAAFIAECQRQGCERLRIIHGKGLRSEAAQPVLKAFVIASLKGHPAVVALRSAGRRDGGSGALRVLLRRV
jgi:DNA-nicking Smr family endonuclease